MTAATAPTRTPSFARWAARAAIGVVVGCVVVAACLPWMPVVEAWLAGHLVALLPGVRGVATAGARFTLARDDGSVADLLVTSSCTWAGGLGLLAGVAAFSARSVPAAARAVVLPGLVFGLANLGRIVVVGVVLVVWRGDYVWTVHSVVGSAVTGLCAVLAVAWCWRLGRQREQSQAADV